MDIPARFIIHQTAHWILNHHMRSALPGYLMLGSKAPVQSLSDLPADALAELGGLLARTQGILESRLQPKWLYVSRFGHEPGYPIHFHFIPVYAWVEALFWKDPRYRVLQAFGSVDNGQALTDGAELTLFIWREFGESPTPPAVEGPSIGEVIEGLRGVFQ